MIDFTGKSVLITGASGFIGYHLSQKIKGRGGYVHAIQHITRVPSKCWDELWYGDLRDQAFVNDLVKESDPDYVFHLASQAIVGEGELNSRYTLDTNINGTLNLFYALSGRQLDSVVVASTDKVYGRNKTLPYTESSPLLGSQQVYEASKHCEDVLAQMARHTFSLPIGITRFGNVYGPEDHHLSRIVPSAIWSNIKKESPVIRSNGQHYRDFIYIDDVVDGYMRLANYIADNKTGEDFIFNFGTGIPVRILDLVVMIGGHFSNKNDPKILSVAEDEIHRQYVDSRLAYEKFGWEAKTRLRIGIAETVAWYKENYKW